MTRGQKENIIKLFKFAIIFGVIAFNPGLSQAKPADGQNQIILLNDSAAALEDSDPGLSRRLAKFADDRQKEWEVRNANKDALPIPVTDKDRSQIMEHIKLLKAAADAIRPTYPLIAKSLEAMAKDMGRSIEIEK